MLGMTIYHFANDVNNVSKLSKRQFQVFKKLQPYLKNNLSSFSNLGKKISFEELTRLCEDHRKINEQFYNKWGVKKI